ncbi:MAG: hypothetical protein ACOH2Q_12040 [Rhodococcus sp. (in: high G+C Gram-positive bacteria)]
MSLRTSDRWTVGALAVVSGALVLVFFFGPAAMLKGRYPQYSDIAVVGDLLRAFVVEFWQNGSGTLSSEFSELVDYWFVWHATKIAISALLILASGTLAVVLWRRFLIERRTRSVGPVVAASAASMLTCFSVLLIVANIQSTVTPLVALLPMLSDSPGDGALMQTLDDLRRGVDESGSPQAQSPALSFLLGQVARYHWTMVVLASILSALFVVASVVAVQRVRAVEPDNRRLRIAGATLGIIGVVMSVVMLFLLITAVIAVASPGEALLDIVGD